MLLNLWKGKGTCNEIRTDGHLHGKLAALSQNWGC